MVVTELTVSFVFVDVEDGSVPKFLWQILLVPHGLEQTLKLVANRFTTYLELLSGDGRDGHELSH